MIEKLKLDAIRVDETIQAREGVDQTTVEDYAERMQAGDTFPPFVVFRDGDDYILAAGFHRHAAAKQAGLSEFDAEVKDGTRRDALLFAAGDNVRHGRRRTNKDKERAVTILLADADWKNWSDHEIARRCHVSQSFVSRTRRSLMPEFSDNADSQPTNRTYTTKHGTQATMNVENIGKTPQGEPSNDAAEPRLDEHCPPSDASPTPNKQMEADAKPVDAPPAANAQATPTRTNDVLGKPLPDNLKPVFCAEFTEIVAAVAKIDGLLHKAKKEWPHNERFRPYFSDVDDALKADLKNVRNSLEHFCPYAVCQRCKGRGCQVCRDTGFITKPMVEQIKTYGDRAA